MEAFEERVNPVTVSVATISDTTEGGSAGVFRFTRSDNTTTFSVTVNTGGTATNAADYSWMPMISFTSGGSLTADVNLTPVNDSLVEGTETMTVTIVPNPPIYGGNGSATINIYDDDTPQVTVSKIADAAENGSAGTFRITRTGPTTSSLGVTFTTGGTATSGTDYTSIGTGATIASGNTYVDVTVTALADNVVESGGETVTITIDDGGSSYTAIGATASLTIADDPPVVSISGTGTAEDANGTFTVSRTGGKLADALTVNYTVTGGTATSGSDFTALSGSVVIGAGKSSADVTLAALADNLIEGDETVEVTISSGGTDYTIGTATATATITDDPPVVSVSRLNDGTEGGSNGTFRVSRTGGDISDSIIVTYTVAGTATYTSNTDYTALSGTVTIASSASYADITVTVTNDSSVEVPETVILTLDTDPDWVNGSASATLFIWDNDGTYIEWEGDENDNWMDPDNWVGGVVPGSSDTAVFSGTTTFNPILSGPLSPVTIAGLVLESGFTGVVTLEFPISVGSLQMAGGTLDQPYSTYGSDITITGAALWTGGVLNSTANAASVIFGGTTAVIAPLSAGTLEFGSNLTLESGAVVFQQEGTLSATNLGQIISVNSGAKWTVNLLSLGSAVIAAVSGSFNIAAGGTLSLNGGAWSYTGLCRNAGTFEVKAGATVFFAGAYDKTDPDSFWSYKQTAGETHLYGSTNIITATGFKIEGGTLATKYADSANSPMDCTATISAAIVEVSAGHIYVGHGSATPGFGQLSINARFNWFGGTYHPRVKKFGGLLGESDIITATGVIEVSGVSGATLTPIPVDAEGATVGAADADITFVVMKTSANSDANSNDPNHDSKLWTLQTLTNPITSKIDQWNITSE